MVGQTDTSGYLKVALGTGGTISGDQTFTGSVTIQGNLDFGDTSADVLTIYGQLHLNDDIVQSFGNTAAAPNCELTWETADANANCLLLTLPEGGAVDVPVFVVGDATASGTNIGLFNGFTDPTIAVLDDAGAQSLWIQHDGTNGFMDVSTGLVEINTGIIITEKAGTSGVPTSLAITGGTHTGITAATEDRGILFDLSANKTWAAGAGPLAEQRELAILAPTYIGDVGAALTMTNASTVYISDAPSAGANMTISNPYALYINAGATHLGGPLSLAGAVTLADDTALGFGDPDSVIEWDTNQTANALVLALGTDSRALIICEKGDEGTDFLVPQQVNPTLIIHSADATDLTDNIALGHDQAGAVVAQVNEGATATAGKQFLVMAGDGGSGTTGGAGGTVKIVAGDAKGTGDNNGGDVIFDVGDLTAAGRLGQIEFANATNGFAGIARDGAALTPIFYGYAADGATAVGVVNGANANFTTAGAKFLSVRNNITAGGGGTEVASFGVTDLLNLTQGIHTTGNPTLLVATGAAHTTLTNNDLNDVYFNLNRSVQFTGGAGAETVGNVYGVRIAAPTYTTAGAGALTITNASTVYISGAPAAGGGGGGTTLGSSWALNVAAGGTKLALGAADKLLIDAVATPHTGTTGALDLDLTTATASVVGLFVTTALTADVDDVSGIASMVTGPTAGGTNGRSSTAFIADLNGDNNDTDHIYKAFLANDYSANGGTNEAYAFVVGTAYDNALIAESGDVVFSDYSATIKAVTTSAGAGDTLTINSSDAITEGAGGALTFNCGDAVTAGAGNNNGGSLSIDLGTKTNMGLPGSIAIGYGGTALGTISPGGSSADELAIFGSKAAANLTSAVIIGSSGVISRGDAYLIRVLTNATAGAGAVTVAHIDGRGNYWQSAPAFSDEMWAGIRPEWATRVTTGTAAAQNQVNGVYRLTTSAVDNEQEGIDWNDICPFVNTQQPTYEIRAKIDQASDIKCSFGLIEASGGGNNSYIKIEVDSDTDTNWYLKIDDDGVGAQTDAGSAADTSFHIFKFVFQDDTTVEWFIDGATQGSIATNIPAGDQLQPFVECQVRANGGARYVEVDYVKVWADRT